MPEHDSILLIAFGGPERPSDIRPFLERVTEGRRIPRDRLEEVAHHYEQIGGRSPFNELTFRQARSLGALLRTRQFEIPVYVGMRNWHPFLDETLAQMRAAGHRRILGIILSAFQTEASWDRYMADVANACRKLGANAPRVEYAAPWSERPLFIAAVADRVATTLRGLPAEVDPALIFTAHSLPLSMAANSPYVAQFERASQAVAEACSRKRWTMAYQSRSGRPTDPWLEPDVGDVLDRLVKENQEVSVVCPIGFVCDHVEVLYDLDFEAGARARELGLGFFRVPTVNDHPLFIEMLAELVEEAER